MDAEFLTELFEPFGEVAPRKMFGGMGVFYRGLNFAIVVDGVLRLKGDDSRLRSGIYDAVEIYPQGWNGDPGALLAGAGTLAG